jgi:hypothetical protein
MVHWYRARETGDAEKLGMLCYSYTSFYDLRWAARGGTYRGLFVHRKKKIVFRT